jgi:hypothetical protein
MAGLREHEKFGAISLDELGMAVPSKNIYIWNEGEYDHSRWIALAMRGPETSVLHLTDLCQPGELSLLASVSCPTSYLRDVVVRGGSLQITLPTGFLLVRRKDDLLFLEFRGKDEISVVRATIKADDVLARIQSQEDAGKLAVKV